MERSNNNNNNSKGSNRPSTSASSPSGSGSGSGSGFRSSRYDSSRFPSSSRNSHHYRSKYKDKSSDSNDSANRRKPSSKYEPRGRFARRSVARSGNNYDGGLGMSGNANGNGSFGDSSSPREIKTTTKKSLDSSSTGNSSNASSPDGARTSSGSKISSASRAGGGEGKIDGSIARSQAARNGNGVKTSGISMDRIKKTSQGKVNSSAGSLKDVAVAGVGASAASVGTVGGLRAHRSRIIGSMRHFLAALKEKVGSRSAMRLAQHALQVSKVGAVAATASTAFAHMYGRRVVNRDIIPILNKSATRCLGRDVDFGKCHSLSPLGVIGLTSIMVVGPLSVGPTFHEKSRMEIERLAVKIHVIESIKRRRWVLNAIASKPILQLAQASNYSWFGFPDDTTPSSRPVFYSPTSTKSNDSVLNTESNGSPSVVIDGINFESGKISYAIHTDTIHNEKPREIRDLRGRVHMNWDVNEPLQRVKIEASGDPVARFPSNPRHTMPSNGVRHRRNTAVIDKGTKLRDTFRNTKGGRIRASAILRTDSSSQDAPIEVQIEGRDLHAALLENILEIPIDIYDGRLNGQIKLSVNDLKKLDDFPEITGRVECSDLHFHFHDAPDDLYDTKMALVFEDQRMYLHNAYGYYGAIPVQASGDLDIKASDAYYRISAHVPGVDLNALSATLGARPSAIPLAGNVSGDLSVTGPLEFPIFSGTANLCPPKAMRQRWKPPSRLAQYLPEPRTRADDAMDIATSGNKTKAAYDRVPIAEAGLWWTLDSSTNVFSIHDAVGTTTAGGTIRVSGSMDVSPEAEEAINAVNVSIKGEDLPSTSLMELYTPTSSLPPILRHTGPATLRMSISGSHLSPEISADVSIPESDASCNVHSTRKGIKISGQAPSLNVSAYLHTDYPPLAQVRSAKTYLEAAAAAKPFIAGCDVDCNMQGLDLTLIASDKDEMETAPMRPLRLKLSGVTNFRGRARDGKLRSIESNRAKKTEHTQSAFGVPGVPASFAGDITFKGLRLNQLDLAPHLRGKLTVSKGGIAIRTKGRRDDQLTINGRTGSIDDVLTLGSMIPAMTAYRRGILSLRRGNLRLDLDIADRGLKLDIHSLNLDDLELASLRGIVDEGALELGLDDGALVGKGRVMISGPKFSGLKGESLEGKLSWDNDIIRLERGVFQQERSTYELQGEYTLPSKFAALREAVTNATQGAEDYGASGTTEVPNFNATLLKEAISGGRWRCSMVVPKADIEEMLPAARILSSAGKKQTWGEYSVYKEKFIESIKSLNFQAGSSDKSRIEDLKKFVQGKKAKRSIFPLNANFDRSWESLDSNVDIIETISETDDPDTSTSITSNSDLWSSLMDKDKRDNVSGGSKADSNHFAPNIQDLRGTWRGIFNSYGGGSGAVTTEFDIRGEEFLWGNNKMQLNALGGYHSRDGLRFDKINVNSGEMSLNAEGTCLGPKKNHLHLQVCELPLKWFEPFTQYLGKEITKSLPKLSGVIYAQGNLYGSADVPYGGLKIRLLDGFINDDTELSVAQANLSITSDRRCKIQAKVEPSDAGFDSGVTLNADFPMEEQGYKIAIETNRDSSIDQSILVDVSVKNNGMLLLSQLSPSLQWVKGHADIHVRANGTFSKPEFKGTASVSKAIIDAPYFTKPILISSADILFEDEILHVNSFDAKTGRKGIIAMYGSLPVSDATRNDLSKKMNSEGILVVSSGLELRDKSTFAEHVQTEISIEGCLMKPVLSGVISISKGTLYIPSAGGSLSSTDEGSTDIFSEMSFYEKLKQSMVNPLSGLDEWSESSVPPTTNESEGGKMKIDDEAKDLCQPYQINCRDLNVHLGPDIRAVYPFVLNFSLTGDLVFNGPAADPENIRVAGLIRFLSGEVNLVATQLLLSRENENTATFKPEQGLDPTLDISLEGGELRAVIQAPASQWQKKILLTKQGTQSGDPGAPLSPTEIARVFEGQFSGILLEKDGQLAISKMATTTVQTMMPRIETHGHLGKTKWRLVSAPSLPGLLAFDPIRDPIKSIANLGMAQSAEIQYGSKLKGAVSKSLLEKESDTFWQLLYQFKKNLRAQLTSSTSSSPQFFISYSTEDIL